MGQSRSFCLYLLDAAYNIGDIHHLHCCFRISNEMEQISLIISKFSAIYQRTSFYCHFSAIVSHFSVGFYHAWLHIKVHSYHIAFLPVALNGSVTVLQTTYIYCLSVYCDGVIQFLSVSITIQVAGHYLAFHPTWNSHHQFELFCAGIGHLDGNITVPWILGCLFQCHLFTCYGNGSGVAGKQIHIEFVILYGIHISRE